MNDKFTWNNHVEYVCKRSAKRMKFLKMLRRAGATVDDIIYYYKSIIPPVLKYACPDWHSGLSKHQSREIE